LKAFYNVYNAHGYCFYEKVYENSMVIELKEMGLNVAQQSPAYVKYKGQNVGSFFTDIVVNDTFILELKASDVLYEGDCCQLLNYLKATDLELGFLLNFGLKPEFRRKVFSNDRKTFKTIQSS
jgi:GxxExxY protein